MKKYIPVLFLLFVSCSVMESDEFADVVELDRTWEVVEFKDPDGNEVSLDDQETLTIYFNGETSLSGEADCNQYGGDYIARENGRINITNIISTEIACEQPSNGDNFLKALSGASTFVRQEGRLNIYFGGDGKLTLLERLQ